MHLPEVDKREETWEGHGLSETPVIMNAEVKKGEGRGKVADWLLTRGAVTPQVQEVTPEVTKGGDFFR